jgi:hypothetical protein
MELYLFLFHSSLFDAAQGVLFSWKIEVWLLGSLRPLLGFYK